MLMQLTKFLLCSVMPWPVHLLSWNRPAVFPSLVLLSMLIPATSLANSGGPLPQLTGGFGEQTCTSCHVGNDLNAGRIRGGVFHILGVPPQYEPGKVYPLTVVIGQPEQSRWGFELSARHSASGRQAGRLVPADNRTAVTESAAVQYIHHTSSGSEPGNPSGPVEFRFDWVAPDSSGGSVYFNAAGNAANASFDPSGDFIYTAGAFSGISDVPPTGPPPAQPPRPVERRLRTASRLMHLPIPVDLDRGTTEIHVEHRFLQAIDRAGPGGAFGIDAGANISLGIGYAPTDRVSLGISRTRFNRIVTLSSAYELVTAPDSFWKAALVGGIEGQRNFHDHYSPFLQFASSFDAGPVRAFAVPTVIWNSRRDSDFDFGELPAVNRNDNYTFSLGVGADWALHRRFSLSAEYVPRLAGFGGLGTGDRQVFSGGIKLRTWNHVFTIMASNSRNLTPSQYALRGDRGFVLGFNIYRRMR